MLHLPRVSSDFGRHPMVLFKRLLARFVVIGEFCHHCGRSVDQVWWAPDDLWRSITGCEENGVRCIRCFDRECYARDKLLRWTPRVEHARSADGRWSDPIPAASEKERAA